MNERRRTAGLLSIIAGLAAIGILIILSASLGYRAPLTWESASLDISTPNVPRPSIHPPVSPELNRIFNQNPATANSANNPDITFPTDRQTNSETNTGNNINRDINQNTEQDIARIPVSERVDSNDDFNEPNPSMIPSQNQSEDVAENVTNEDTIESPPNLPPSDEQTTSSQSTLASKLELEVHERINQVRTEMGLEPIVLDNALSNIARNHSEDMAAFNYFSHISPRGSDFSDRYEEANYVCRVSQGTLIHLGGENLFTGWTYSSTTFINGVQTSRDFMSADEIADIIVDGWMKSPGHRQNILQPFWNNEGIGAHITNEGKILVTQNFC